MSGDVDAETLAAFKEWRSANPAHVVAFDRARASYADAADHEAMLRPRIARSRRVAVMAVAASLVLAAIVSAKPEFLFPPDYASPAGPARDIVLADGSRMVLDGDSAVDVAFGGSSRTVTLRRGRAFFDVVHQTRPFTVVSGNTRITDIGTAFSVDGEGPAGRVAVSKGAVRVEAGGKIRVLTASKAADWDAASLRDTSYEPDSLAWLHGQIVIRDRSFAAAARELNRYIGPHVLVLGDVAAARVGGSFSTAHALEGLRAIARSQHAEVRELPGLIVVSRD